MISKFKIAHNADRLMDSWRETNPLAGADKTLRNNRKLDSARVILFTVVELLSFP